MAKLYRSTADEKLSDKFASLSLDIESLRGIVQNDMIVTETELDEWELEARGYLDLVQALIAETLIHVKEGTV